MTTAELKKSTLRRPMFPVQDERAYRTREWRLSFNYIPAGT